MPPRIPLFPYTTLFRSSRGRNRAVCDLGAAAARPHYAHHARRRGRGRSLERNGVRSADGAAAAAAMPACTVVRRHPSRRARLRSEEHTSELQSLRHLVCRLASHSFPTRRSSDLVVAEIALFAISGRLPLAPTTLIMLGAAGAVVRWSAMAFDPPTALLPPLQCLHALSFGATHLGALGFMARAAPAELGATAQGYLAVALGLVMAAAMGISGLLYARWGGLAYGAMALAAAAGGVFALAAHRLTDGTQRQSPKAGEDISRRSDTSP